MGNDPFLSAGTEQTSSASAVHVFLLWVFSSLYKAYPLLWRELALQHHWSKWRIVVVPVQKIRDITARRQGVGEVRRVERWEKRTRK